MSEGKAGKERVKISLALILNWVAGCVDAVCYLALFQVFVANMSGNTVGAAIGWGEHRWEMLRRRGAVIPLFLLGLILSRIAVEGAIRRDRRAVAVGPFILEALLLAAFAAWGGSYPVVSGRLQLASGTEYYFLLALPTVAMGIQNAVLTHFGPLTVRTTHVTGTLSQFADSLVNYLYWHLDRVRKRAGPQRPGGMLAQLEGQGALREALLLLTVWLFYLGGGAAGVALKARYEVLALFVPAAILVALAALDAFHPISGEMERR